MRCDPDPGGRQTQGLLAQLADEDFRRRLTRFARLEIIEVPDSDPELAGLGRDREVEWSRFLRLGISRCDQGKDQPQGADERHPPDTVTNPWEQRPDQPEETSSETMVDPYEEVHASIFALEGPCPIEPQVSQEETDAYVGLGFGAGPEPLR